MKIVAWKDISVAEDGSAVETWMASHVGRAITAAGPTAANAVFQLVSWLLISKNPQDNSVADIDTPIYDAPSFPDDHIKSPEAEVRLRKKRLTADDITALMVEVELAYRVRGLVPPAPPAPRYLYEESSAFIFDRFEAGGPFTDPHVQIPSGWDVRVWEG